MATWMLRAGRRLAGSTLGDTFTVAYTTRITGLAAEASFWGLFALPWLFLGLIAGMSHLESLIGVDAVEAFRTQIIDLAGRVLTPEAIDELLVPMLDEILVKGRSALGLIGAVAAVWAGSRLIGALVDGMTIVYQRQGLRGFVMTRVVSLSMYIVGLLGLIVMIPVIVAGPSFLARVLPGDPSGFTAVLLIVIQVSIVAVLVVSLYHWSVPHRTPWRADAPGALIAMGLWVVFSWALRWYFAWLFRAGSVYGVIAAPIAVMMWTYVTCMALLLGAAFNAALAVRRGWFEPVNGVASPERPGAPGDPVSPVDSVAERGST